MSTEPDRSVGQALQVVVTGDVTVDWNLARSGDHSSHAYWASGRQTKAYRQMGGAALLGRVVEQMTQQCFSGGVQVWYPGESCQSCCSSFSVWESFPKTDKKGEKEKAWRVAEYLGADPTPAGGAPGGDKLRPPEKADLVILDDAGLGFSENEAAWPKALLSTTSEVLLKMSAWQREDGSFRHLADGKLFQYLGKEHADRLTVILNVSDLRLRDAAVSRDLSWEQTGMDLASEFEHNPLLEPLSACARLVVRLGAAGIFLRERSGQDVGSTLYYDPAEIGDSWESHHPGGVIGYTVCTTAAVARHCLRSRPAGEWKITFQRAIGAARSLHLEGYEYQPLQSPALRFPLAAVVEQLAMDQPADATKKWSGTELCEATLPSARREQPSGWTILAARFPDGYQFPGGASAPESVLTLGAEEALRWGRLQDPQTDSKLLSVPVALYGGLKTIDRQEIENLRSIGRLVKEYCAQSAQTPLSFAVFGPPGCGKSFAIGQLADNIIAGKTTKLTFNLSQFSSPAELAEAFHQVRDAALRGEMPLVFWDEFDAKLNDQSLGWLKYFLAPMQDGCFQAGPLTHPVGRAIFAFAGSVRPTMREFEEYTNQPQFEDAKGRDFISRLKGFVNILGPNPPLDSKGDIIAGKDPHYVLRRAIILRSTLERERLLLFDGESRLRVDGGVMRALLLVSKYRHGVRSMNSIIAMSMLDGKLKFERSCLPPAAQLDLHVDAAEFLAIINGIHFAGFAEEKIEAMAREVHQVFYEDLVRKGFGWAEKTDEPKLKHECCIEWDGRDGRNGLGDRYKEENRRLVRAIPERLLRVRHTVARLDRAEHKLSDEAVDPMAEMEHERWMWSKLRDGFRYDPISPRKPDTNECLLPWNAMDDGERRLRYGAWASGVGAAALPDEQKEKDRLLIRAIPRILKAVGLQVMPIPASER